MKNNKKLSPEVFKLIIDTISEPTSLVDSDYSYIYVNNAYCSFLNKTKEEIIGKYIWDNTGKRNFDDVIKPYLDSALKGETVSYLNEVKLLGNPPKFYHLVMNYQPFNIPGSTEPLVLSSAIDITNETKLKTHWKNTVNAIDDVILIINKDLDIEDINNAGVKLIGKKYDEIIGRKCYHMIHNKETKEPFCPISVCRKSRKKEHVIHFEERLGKWYSYQSTPVFNKDGEISHFVDVMRDVTTMKEKEEKLRDREEKYHAMYQNAPLAYQSLNINGHIIDINPMWGKTLGYKREEVIGKWFGNFLHKDYVDHFRTNFPKFKKRGSISNVQFCMVKKDGSEIYVSFEGCIGYTPEGEFRQTYCTFKDITEEISAKNELIKAKEKAEESERLKSAFLANMSHEIRTPMNGILGFANLLKDPRLSTEEQEKYISIIEEGGERLLNIINDLISISKIEANQVEVNSTEVNIHEILDYMINFFSPEAEKKGIKLSLVIPSRKDHIILNSDKEKLFAIFTNLIKNAIKYTDQGEISFGYVLLDGRIRFFVKDSGIGIPEEKLDGIFNRFEQVHQSLNTPYEGAGLGLSIVKAYVEMLGGEIFVKSKFGVGSEFVFYHPLEYKTSYTAPPNVSSVKNSCEHLKKLKVLLVEDDPTSMILLEEMLNGCFRETVKAEDGQAALDMITQHPDIDLILLDLKIPKVDGLEVARKIRDKGNNVKIIAQTAFAFADDETKARNAGCDQFISKPIQQEQLKEMILSLFPTT